MASGRGLAREVKQRFWQEQIARWRHSGLSVRQFCQREGLSEPSFYAWRRVLSQRGTSVAARPADVAHRSNFVSVRVAEPSACKGSMIEILLPRGRRVRVGPGFDRATLEEVLEILRRQSC